jgi:hypothetical protein
MYQEQLCRNHTLFARDCGRIRSTLSLPRSASILEPSPCISFSNSTHLLQTFPKFNKTSQLDYFLLGCLKSKLYDNRPNNLENLKQRIQHEIRLISYRAIQNIRNEFNNRLGCCQMVQGRHFEYLL